MSTIKLNDLSKSFGETRALLPLSLEVHDGEFFSLLGPSGCGKTTLLRIIAGLEEPSSGSVVIDGTDITRLPPQERNVGVVFQNYALFPHMTVFNNVAYGLEVQKKNRPEIRSKVMDVLAKVHLTDKANVPVPSLSGGEQQRVAVARAIVVAPRVLLFDEPLSNLDYALRLETRAEIKRLQRDVGITTIYVTHDQGEALALSDRIAVLNKGMIQQIGTPDDLYFHPRNTFTASFIGHANLFSSKVCKEFFRIGTVKPGEFLAVLPDEIILSNRAGKMRAKIIDRQFSGSHVEYTLEFGEERVRVSRTASDKKFEAAVGEFATLTLAGSHLRKVADA